MTDFVIADTHFGHRNIIGYTRRRFCLNAEELALMDSGAPAKTRRNPNGWEISPESVARHDEYLLRQINRLVQPKDRLWHVGDYCWGPRGKGIVDVARRYREAINCRHVNLIWGNHDYRDIGHLFERTYDRYRLKWQGERIILCHCAHAVWEDSHRGGWNLYRHSHTTAEEALDQFMPQRRSMDVGVDNAFRIFGEYRPIALEEIRDLFRTRTGHSIDCHKNNE